MSIARRTLYDYVSQVGMMAVSVAAGILIARALRAEGKGVYQGVLLAVTLGTNLTNFAVRAANQYHVGKDPSRAGAAHTLTLLFATASSCIAFLAAWALWSALLHRLQGGGDPSQASRLAWNPSQIRQLWWAVPVLPLSLYYFGWGGIMVGLGRIRQYAVYNFAFQLANAVAIGVVLLARGGVGGLLGAWTGLWVAGAVVMAAMLRDHPPRLAIDRPLLAATVSFGARAFAGNFASNIMMFFNKIAIGGYGGAAAFSVYTTADGYANKFALHHEALERGAFQSVASTERDDAVRLTCRLTRISLLLGLGVWVFGGAASSILLWLNGPQFVAGIAPMWAMMGAPLALGGSRMMAMYYTGQLGRPQIPTALAWAGATLNVALVWPLAARWGLMGAAVATSVSFMLHFLLYVALFRREMKRLGLPLSDLLLVRRADWALFLDYARRAMQKALILFQPGGE
ncbi:MAG: polysaccharide biosynthesis C-terminal domain-containing protein [Candidatus Sumerlaeota bacterium]|nr:polysaccharide biosynthesis C-terminal domain-containing protein [Candidatus Sumerlaeota bacterium]